MFLIRWWCVRSSCQAGSSGNDRGGGSLVSCAHFFLLQTVNDAQTKFHAEQRLFIRYLGQLPMPYERRPALLGFVRRIHAAFSPVITSESKYPTPRADGQPASTWDARVSSADWTFVTWP